jgi:hypothetical protein
MAHKGIKEWSGEELSNVALGQNGFHVIHGSGTTTAASLGIQYWIAIKNVNGNAGLQARSILPGNDLAESGTQNTTASNNIDVVDGDIVYGAFDQIYMDQAGEYVIAYIGK